MGITIAVEESKCHNKLRRDVAIAIVRKCQ